MRIKSVEKTGFYDRKIARQFKLYDFCASSLEAVLSKPDDTGVTQSALGRAFAPYCQPGDSVCLPLLWRFALLRARPCRPGHAAACNRLSSFHAGRVCTVPPADPTPPQGAGNTLGSWSRRCDGSWMDRLCGRPAQRAGCPCRGALHDLSGFTLLIAWIVFRVNPSLRAIGAAGLIIVAAFVASGPATVGPHILTALLLSLAAPLGFGLGITVLVYRLTGLTPLARIAAVSLGSVLGLLPLIVTAPPSMIVPQESQGWVLLLGIALGTALIPQLVYSICAPIAGAAQTAVIGSIELPTMFAVGLIAFGERISPGQITACLLILLAILIGSRDCLHNTPAK